MRPNELRRADGGLDGGSLEAGKLADLVVLDQNPLVNLRHTSAIRYLMKSGRLCDGNTLEEVRVPNDPKQLG